MQLWVLHKRTGIIRIRLRHRRIRIRRGATAAAARGRQRLVFAVILGHHNAHDHSDNDDPNQRKTAANHLFLPSVKIHLKKVS